MAELRNIVNECYSGRGGSRSVFWHSLAPILLILWAEQHRCGAFRFCPAHSDPDPPDGKPISLYQQTTLLLVAALRRKRKRLSFLKLQQKFFTNCNSVFLNNVGALLQGLKPKDFRRRSVKGKTSSGLSRV